MASGRRHALSILMRDDQPSSQATTEYEVDNADEIPDDVSSIGTLASDLRAHSVDGKKMACSVCLFSEADFNDPKLHNLKLAVAAVRLPLCGHMFHRHCIRKWADERKYSSITTCPICRCPHENARILHKKHRSN